MKRYKITDKVIACLINPKTGKAVKICLEQVFNCSAQSVNSWVRYNETDGPLTREAALRVIEQGFKLTRSEVLCEVDIIPDFVVK